MLSSMDLERLIAVKRLEIEKEKTQLGLSPLPREPPIYQEDKGYGGVRRQLKKEVSFTDDKGLCEHNDVTAEKKENHSKTTQQHLEETIPPDLERYIRRYLGLPVMLKAGEYSPNNPLIRGERPAGDVMLGLGEYERQRNTLRRIRQQQYREYLDQQAKKKQEAKEQVERERREREERERAREEREQELLLERNIHSPQRRRVSVVDAPVTATVYCNNKVDTGVQVDRCTRPLSVAVQTDETEFYQVAGGAASEGSAELASQRTPAERELSPRGASQQAWPQRERSSTTIKECNRDKLISDLRHSYMPSLFDADAIRLRNLQAEKEAAERRQYYQQELKNQIVEQQRIREERKNREKMLELAEMRRLEQQLRSLRADAHMKENAETYNKKRTELQKEIDAEQHKLFHVTTQPIRNTTSCTPTRSDRPTKLPFQYTKSTTPNYEEDKKPYSINISDNSIFSSNYDVDSYLRRNLNFNKEIVREKDLSNIESATTLIKDLNDNRSDTEAIPLTANPYNIGPQATSISKNDDYHVTARKVDNVEGDAIKVRKDFNNIASEAAPQRLDLNIYDASSYFDGQPRILQKDLHNMSDDTTAFIKPKRPQSKCTPSDNNDLPIPVLKHTPSNSDEANDNSLSDKMKTVDAKWRVPAVQKNILKSYSKDEGGNISILTQLGSIRRQLQLEQLKLDRLSDKCEE